VLGAVLGDVLGWVGRVFGHIGDLEVYWLVLALALKTGESGFIGLTYRNILRASYPRSNVSFKTAWGGSAGGTAVNALVPAQAGTAVMIGIFRSVIPGSAVSGLTTVFFVESAFFLAISIVMLFVLGFLRPPAVSRGSPSDEVGAFLSHHMFVVPLAIVVLAVVLRVLWPRLKPRLLAEWRKAKEGAAIFRDWGRYAREVAFPSLLSYCCRLGVNAVFMVGFGVPVSAFTVVLVVSSHVLSGLFRLTPGGLGQSQAVDVLALRPYASADTVAAFSVSEASVAMLWTVVLGAAVMIWAFGFTQMRQLLGSVLHRRRARPA
jgi:lysylphosphatidylglycerol synthase-like protein